MAGTVEIVSDPSLFSQFPSGSPHQRGRNHNQGFRGGWRGGGGGGHGGHGYQNTNRFVDFNKPWVTQGIRSEIWKKKSLAEAAKKSKTADTVAALQTQSELVDKMLSEAKISWLASHPEMEADWLAVMAREESSRTYFCDVCEKMVGSLAEYNLHVSQHATCGIDGCGYTAHQDILEKHIMHQHMTGFYNRIVQGNTPEDIEKWREERRKNWPTQMKIAEKIVEKEMLKERGEVMHLKREKRRRDDVEVAARQVKQKSEQEQSWECNCKARQYVESLRGRRRQWIPRNVRHQSHCAELLKIRERAKEKREKRQAAWEEKKEKMKAEVKNCDKGNDLKKDHFGEEESNIKRAKFQDLDSSSDEEGWNGGLWMFKGTVNLEKERMKANEDSIVIEETTIKPFLVSYENYDSDDNDDDDEAPEEIKTIVSYENDLPSDDQSIESFESKGSRKTRKRKKKTSHQTSIKSDVIVAKSEKESGTQNASEDALKEVRATIQSHIESFQEPPVPGEEALHSNKDIGEAIPEDDNHHDEFVEETVPEINPKPDVPVVFKRRLRHPTLLERLLLSEIKNERNSILQCVRYVCKNNFFRDTQTK